MQKNRFWKEYKDMGGGEYLKSLSYRVDRRDR